jgi:hypothetical protein
MQRKSCLARSEDGRYGWATFYLDGHRIDLHVGDGKFTLEVDAKSITVAANANYPVSLAMTLEELAATFKDAAKQERERLAARKEAP